MNISVMQKAFITQISWGRGGGRGETTKNHLKPSKNKTSTNDQNVILTWKALRYLYARVYKSLSVYTTLSMYSPLEESQAKYPLKINT